MGKRSPVGRSRNAMKAVALAVSLLGTAGVAHAHKFETDGEWDLNLDTSLQYTLGVRAQDQDPGIANHPFFQAGDAKFNKGDVVTNRAQGLFELQGVYKGNAGFRMSASAWNDMAYNADVKGNQALSPYVGGQYSDYTKKYTLQGGELLDAFVFGSDKINDTPVHLKAGRFTQQWGNAFFFGFSSISYSQHPTDFIKAFSQPGSEVKELFLPRTQLMGTAELTPELSVSAQYFLEYRENRFPQGGTFLGPFDILYNGTQTSGALAGTSGAVNRPKNVNGNFGVKTTWSPEWAKGDIGFYYRQLDEVQQWALGNMNANAGVDVSLSYAQKVKLWGLSYERTFGTVSTGFEANIRQNTALNSAFMATSPGAGGAKGNIFNGIANSFVQLGRSSWYDAGVLLGELSYTQLMSVTENAAAYNGVGTSACTTAAGAPQYKWDGCSTKHSLAAAVLFEPQWLQAFPGIDLSMPTSYTYGVSGNPAYAAGSFYAQGTNIYSIGVKGTMKGGTTAALAYNGYHWRPSSATGPAGSYNGFGGNGPVALNDKGWFQLTLKTSF
jgi:Protein of unknown function (DUF1302)